MTRPLTQDEILKAEEMFKPFIKNILASNAVSSLLRGYRLFITEGKQLENKRANAEVNLHPRAKSISFCVWKNSLEGAVSNFIHECIHVLRPDLQEETVTTLSKALYEISTMNERQRLFRFIAQKAKWCN